MKNWPGALKYSAVGLFGTAIDLLITVMLVEHAGWGILQAASAAFILTFIHNYIWNRRWTFRFRTRIIRKTAVKIFISALIGLILTVALMYMLCRVLNVYYAEAKLLTSAGVLICNFLLNKWWVFRIDRNPPDTSGDPEFDVSIIGPAFNEAARIGVNLKKIRSYFSQSGHSSEIIVVDDGSSDGTAGLSENELAGFEAARVIVHPKNMGKGAAIRTGVLASAARYVLITDADGSTPIEEFEVLMDGLKSRGFEIAVGSRYLRQSKVKLKQPLYRIAIGRIGNLLIRFFLIDGIRDTQCGFKLFEGSCAKDIFSRSKISGWGFDIEALAIAKMLNMNICELPVEWRDCPGSRLRPFRDAFKTLTELAYIKLNIWSGRYEKNS
ncbi:MAG: glycosyltransferase [Candidatus Omnitrophica bacterium]|nr:glycosyltransferase [Candidatus Omnitrophota bacterium]